MLAVGSVIDPDSLDYAQWSIKLRRSLRSGSLDHFEGYPHEEDFRVLRCLDEGDLFVDVGANVGQSILSALAINPSIRVASFEANPGLWPLLEQVRDHFSQYDLRIYRYGLSDQVAELPFFIPALGAAHLATRASADRRVFTDRNVAAMSARFARTGEQIRLVETRVQVRPLDELGLEPRFVKIDVEGLEADVLRGMSETISRAAPMIMVEGHSDDVRLLLCACGYRPWFYHEVDGKLRRERSPSSPNTIWVTEADEVLLRDFEFLS